MNLARRAPEGAGAAESASAHSAGPYESVAEGWRRLVVFPIIVRQFVLKSNKNDTEIGQQWDESGPGGGKGYPEINKRFFLFLNT